ncbi:MAG: GNAT family N-acetyltransferase [Lachnospiraceae bacterium]|nr:GNAT family N-acetyltransferase [Lachnospiraceae bacterium]
MLELKANALEYDTYMHLRKEVGWKMLSKKQAQTALSRCLYNVVAYEDGEAVGMGRIVGDGAVICYIQDLVILPSAQGHGIGSAVLQNLISYVESITEDGTEMMLCLMCAKGREGFYKKHDFMARPTSGLGPGMIQYIRKMF